MHFRVLVSCVLKSAIFLYDEQQYRFISVQSACKHIKVPVVMNLYKNKQTNKLHGLSPRANYTDRATASCRRSDCQLLRIKGATWSA
jgi:hypothetical protein